MKLITILLLSFGFVPAVVTPFSTIISHEDTPSMIRYKMKLKNISLRDVVRGTNLSFSLIDKNISKVYAFKNHLDTIIKFINEKK